MKHNFTHMVTALLLVVLLVLLTDPFMLWMPALGAMALLLCATILVCVWAGFVMYEKAGDERETMHRMHAGRVAYLAGIAVLTLALVVQGLSHHIDPWIAGALGMMVLAKLIARIFFEERG